MEYTIFETFIDRKINKKYQYVQHNTHPGMKPCNNECLWASPSASPNNWQHYCQAEQMKWHQHKIKFRLAQNAKIREINSLSEYLTYVTFKWDEWNINSKRLFKGVDAVYFNYTAIVKEIENIDDYRFLELRDYDADTLMIKNLNIIREI